MKKTMTKNKYTKHLLLIRNVFSDSKNILNYFSKYDITMLGQLCYLNFDHFKSAGIRGNLSEDDVQVIAFFMAHNNLQFGSLGRKRVTDDGFQEFMRKGEKQLKYDIDRVETARMQGFRSASGQPKKTTGRLPSASKKGKPPFNRRPT